MRIAHIDGSSEPVPGDQAYILFTDSIWSGRPWNVVVFRQHPSRFGEVCPSNMCFLLNITSSAYKSFCHITQFRWKRTPKRRRVPGGGGGAPRPRDTQGTSHQAIMPYIATQVSVAIPTSTRYITMPTVVWSHRGPIFPGFIPLGVCSETDTCHWFLRTIFLIQSVSLTFSNDVTRTVPAATVRSSLGETGTHLHFLLDCTETTGESSS